MCIRDSCNLWAVAATSASGHGRPAARAFVRVLLAEQSTTRTLNRILNRCVFNSIREYVKEHVLNVFSADISKSVKGRQQKFSPQYFKTSSQLCLSFRLIFYQLLIAFSALTLLVGRQEAHLACKNWVVGCWCGCLSGVRCRLAYGPADATASHCLLLQ